LIDILMSVFNGEKYLTQQLESILQQTNTDWRLIVRDDGSKDGSPDIIKKYCREYAPKIIQLKDRLGNAGACQSFNLLISYALEKSTSDFFMFADQDDVWDKDKIQLSLLKMKELEEGDKGLPALVHTDLWVCDEKLNLICSSFWRYQKLRPWKKGFNNYLVQNNVTGCTMLVNRSLLEKAYPISQQAVMHDWWLALVASAFGKVAYIDKPLIKYRQHSGNNIGAKKYSPKYLLNSFLKMERLLQITKRKVNQGKGFVQAYGGCQDNAVLQMAGDFAQILSKNRLGRLKIIFQNRLWMQDLIKSLGLLLTLMLINRERK